ncbi:MAG TPA: AI-2E family transporter YdiK, partial [Gemmatimonadales bacterium]|nr:AI-2E family transporter YdiK [Gemmatimonadales bacterium]
ELIRRILAVLVVLLLAFASLWILLPFLPAIIWAATIVVATWPLLERVQSRVGGRRWLATTIMSLIMLLLFFVPVGLAVTTVVDHAGDAAELGRDIATNGLPDPPAWVAGLPVVGGRVDAKWREFGALPPDELMSRIAPRLRDVSAWMLAKAGGLLLLTVQFVLTVVVTALLYANGEYAAAQCLAVARRLGGERGEELMRLAGRSVRGVALGVVVTALAQALVAGIALAATGIPAAAILTVAVFFLCLAQVGPILVMAPAVAWLYWSKHPTAGTVLLVAMLVVATMDGFLRPVLIKRGANLPLVLVFSGVIGGMLTFGIIGIFVGPVMLAVGWTLLEAWVRGDVEVSRSRG